MLGWREMHARLIVPLALLAQRTRRQGGRLCFVNEHGDVSDVVF